MKNLLLAVLFTASNAGAINTSAKGENSASAPEALRSSTETMLKEVRAKIARAKAAVTTGKRDPAAWPGLSDAEAREKAAKDLPLLEKEEARILENLKRIDASIGKTPEQRLNEVRAQIKAVEAQKAALKPDPRGGAARVLALDKALAKLKAEEAGLAAGPVLKETPNKNVKWARIKVRDIDDGKDHYFWYKLDELRKTDYKMDSVYALRGTDGLSDATTGNLEKVPFTNYFLRRGYGATFTIEKPSSARPWNKWIAANLPPAEITHHIGNATGAIKGPLKPPPGGGKGGGGKEEKKKPEKADPCTAKWPWTHYGTKEELAAKGLTESSAAAMLKAPQPAATAHDMPAPDADATPEGQAAVKALTANKDISLKGDAVAEMSGMRADAAATADGNTRPAGDSAAVAAGGSKEKPPLYCVNNDNPAINLKTGDITPPAPEVKKPEAAAAGDKDFKKHMLQGSKMGMWAGLIGVIFTGPVGLFLFGVAGLGLGYAMAKEADK